MTKPKKETTKKKTTKTKKKEVSNWDVPDMKQVPTMVLHVPRKENYGYYEIRAPLGFKPFQDRELFRPIAESFEMMAEVLREVDTSSSPRHRKSTEHTEHTGPSELGKRGMVKKTEIAQKEVDQIISEFSEPLQKELLTMTRGKKPKDIMPIILILRDEYDSVKQKRIEIGGVDMTINPLSETGAAMILAREKGETIASKSVSSIDFDTCPQLGSNITIYENESQYGPSYSMYCSNVELVHDWIKEIDTSIRRRKGLKYPVVSNKGNSIIFMNDVELNIMKEVADRQNVLVKEAESQY